MGNCIYCGENAGFLHSKHKECEVKHQGSLADIRALIQEAFTNSEHFKTPLSEAIEKADQEKLKVDDYKSDVLKNLTAVVVKRYEAGDVNSQFVKDVDDTVRELNLDIGKSGEKQVYQRLSKTLILADLKRGVLPTAFGASNFRPPVNLQKGESVIWVFRNVKFYEDRTHSRRVGGGRGVSVRVAKGVYYHTGRFASHTATSVQRDHIDTGDFLVGTKSLYFAGSSKGFRLPYNKIISLEPFTDAMGIIKDGVNAKHQLFVTDDGWFLYNLSSIAASM